MLNFNRNAPRRIGERLRIINGPIIFILSITGCASSRLEEFERVLAMQDSATTALSQWCEARAIANPPLIRAESFKASPAPSDEVRRLLGVSVNEPLAYRHVHLICGNAVLSVADNWYLPDRLTAEMNQALATTQKPFGQIIAPLGFYRERLTTIRGRAESCPAGTVISHQALLRLSDGAPLAVVTECYTSENLTR